MAGKSDGTLSFILLSDRPRRVYVPDGLNLEGLTDGELVELLEAAK